MSNLAHDTVNQFGKRIGIDSLELTDKGLIRFTIENMGDVAIEAKDSHVLLYMERELRYPTIEIYQEIFKICDMDEVYNWVINVALRADKYLIISLRFPENDFILSNLEEGIGLLSSLHDKISSTH